jgi:hypothetical protein
MWSALRSRQSSDGVPQRAGAGGEPDLGKLGRCLGGDAEDVAAGAVVGAVDGGGRGGDAGGLSGLAQALGACGLRDLADWSATGCRRFAWCPRFAWCRRFAGRRRRGRRGALVAAAMRAPTRKRAEDV